MMRSDPLRPNWPYLAFCVIAAAAGLSFVSVDITMQFYADRSTGRSISGGWSWEQVIFLDVACLALFLAVLAKVRADVGVRITETELTRPTLLGTRRIRWSEIRDVTTVGYGLHVHGPSGKIVLTPYAYRDPDAFVRLVFERVRSHGLRGQ